MQQFIMFFVCFLRRRLPYVGLLFLLFLAASSLANAVECPRPAGKPIPREQLHLYLLMGQSNMAGRGKMTAEDRQPVDGVFMLDAKNAWQPAGHPLHFDKPHVAGVGLGLDFAQGMREHDHDAVIGLIPCAVGGTRLGQWKPGGNLYDQALVRAKVAARCGVLRGVLWHQGESDSPPKLAQDYAQRLGELVAQLRKDLDSPVLPIVVGEIGHFRVRHPSDLINRQLQQFVKQTPNAACATAEDLDHNGDETHFDASSLKEFGRRYGAKMIELQR